MSSDDSTPTASSSRLNQKKDFCEARENSIEVYDDKLGRHSILTRSARIRKFKFYQYKPLSDSATKDPKPQAPVSSPSPVVLLPREDIFHGKIPLNVEQSKEVCELDNKISELERRIADLNKERKDNINGQDNIDEIFDLVAEKNDLLRRQMQLNILEQEKVLEKTNEELTKELRSLMSIDDSIKTRAELDRQQYLYEQSLALVARRNELVHHMDVQEKGIEDDNELKARLKTAITETSKRNRSAGQDQNCSIQ